MRFDKIYDSPILMAALCSFWGCDKDEDHLSEAVLASANTLNFEAERAAEKIITIYADADWVTEVPDWVTVTPDSGTGVMDVTISVIPDQHARRCGGQSPQSGPSSSRDGLLQAAPRCSSCRTETNTAM